MAEPYEPDWIDKVRNYYVGNGPETMRRMTESQRSLNPVSVGQAASLLGQDTAMGLADPNQLTKGPDTTQPSAVPHYQLSGGMPTPQVSQPQFPGMTGTSTGQPMPQGPPIAMAGERGMPPNNSVFSGNYNMGPDQSGWPPKEGQGFTGQVTPNMGPPMLRPMGSPSVVPTPLTPDQGPQPSLRTPMSLTEGPRPNITVPGEQQLDPNSPANPLTRSLVEGEVLRRHKYPPRYGNSGHGSTDLLAAKEQDAFDYFVNVEGKDEQTARAMAKGIVSGAYNTMSLDKRRGDQTTLGKEGNTLRGKGLDIAQQNANTNAARLSSQDRHNLATEAISIMAQQNKVMMNRQEVQAFLLSKGLAPSEENQQMLGDAIGFVRGEVHQPVQEPTSILGQELPYPNITGHKGFQGTGEPYPYPNPSGAKQPALNQGEEGLTLLKELEAHGGAAQYEGKLIEHNGKKYRITKGKPVPEK